jgi:uncharacterized OB-fold protein
MTIEITDEELVATFPGRSIDHDNEVIYRGWLAHELRGMRCDDCGAWHLPPRPVCPSCWSKNVVAVPLRGSGTIFMFVLLHQGPPAPGVDYVTPHPVVTVDMDEQPGLRVTTTVVGASNDEIEIGARVEVDWIERSGAPMPVFRIVPSGS